jgi:hypothetical protein
MPFYNGFAMLEGSSPLLGQRTVILNPLTKATKLAFRQTLFGLTVICVGLGGCVAGHAEMEREVMQYSGDGVIHTCSTLLVAGYAIEFPKFSAAKPYQTSYRLSNVPQTSRAKAGICLRFNQPNFIMARKRKRSVTASFHLTLYDARNNVLHSAEVQVSRSGWSERKRLFSVYAAAKSYVHFERNAKYILNVSYTPGAIPPPAKELYFAIDNCGFY